jgi:hypothetical protein
MEPATVLPTGVDDRAGRQRGPGRRSLFAKGPVGQRPAILAPQIRNQTQHQRPRVPQWLTASEPRRDPIRHLTEARTPPINVYAMSRGDRPNQRKHADNHHLRLQY